MHESTRIEVELRKIADAGQKPKAIHMGLQTYIDELGGEEVTEYKGLPLYKYDSEPADYLLVEVETP